MTATAFSKLVDMERMRKLLKNFHQLTQMAIGVFDLSEEALVAVGWDTICPRFHRANPGLNARCRKNDLVFRKLWRACEQDYYEFTCSNGMLEMTVPIVVDGTHVATLFTGHFFYEDTPPDMERFRAQGERFGIDVDAYLRALTELPVLPREDVRNDILFLRDMVKLLAECGTNALRLTQEVEERRRVEAQLHLREQEFRSLAENSPDPIVRFDRDLRRSYVNPSFARLMGSSPQQLLGRTSLETPLGDSKIGALLWQATARVRDEKVPADLEVSWKDGSDREQVCQFRLVPECDQDGEVAHVLSTGRDISEIKNFQRELHRLAFYDPLTGLPNRALFGDRLEQAVAEAGRHQRHMGLLSLDLDHFKSVNDTLGHRAGDKVLRESAERLRKCVRDSDTVARLGGDEFAIVLPEVAEPEAINIVARKILGVFEAPFVIDGKELTLTTSIGIACYPRDSRDAAELVQHADMAMYHAKASGRNNHQFFSEKLSAEATERALLVEGLRQALKHKELELHYQPKVDMATGGLIGAEALLRWHHPHRGMVPPAVFVPLAEATGLILEIGEWVLRQVCHAAAAWNRRGWGPLTLAVNISPRQFEATRFVGMVERILTETGCQPAWLEIEITESLLLANNTANLTSLKALQGMGIRIAIDDFGTGYSALGCLTRFPINVLKIDQSFIRDVTINTYSAELVAAIISLAKSLRMGLVAEGVETPEQADYLFRQGCYQAQGYLFGKPMPHARFETLLQEGVARYLNRLEGLKPSGRSGSPHPAGAQ